uniref:Uncharacterized protein n=1 Tax=Xiphophorus maculatus TaxID=8083 RepID=A0A3B5QQS8_XIPMA
MTVLISLFVTPCLDTNILKFTLIKLMHCSVPGALVSMFLLHLTQVFMYVGFFHTLSHLKVNIQTNYNLSETWVVSTPSADRIITVDNE